MKKIRFYKKTISSKRGFTLIEILLVMVIVSILAGTLFISVGNQRQKARLNAVLQTARGVQAVAQECYFRVRMVDLPNDTTNPSNEICQYSKTTWMPITVDECHYSPTGGTSNNFYTIDCPSFGKQVRCDITAGGKCEII